MGRKQKSVTPARGAERVKAIIEAMTTGTWGEAKLVELAAEWGIQPVAVRRYSAEAHRLLAGCYADLEAKRAEWIGWLETGARGAMQDREWAALAKCIREASELIGLRTKKSEQAPTSPLLVPSTAAIRALPSDEQRRVIAQLREGLSAYEKELETQGTAAKELPESDAAE